MGLKWMYKTIISICVDVTMGIGSEATEIKNYVTQELERKMRWLRILMII